EPSSPTLPRPKVDKRIRRKAKVATPAASSAQVRRIMQGNVGRDTVPELLLRSVLSRAGVRYRINYRPTTILRGTADIAFVREKVCIFVDGCFWHHCPRHGRFPKTNSGYWAKKLNRTMARDRHYEEVLSNMGWSVLRIWAHEAPERAARAVLRL